MTCTFWVSAKEYPKVEGHQCGSDVIATTGVNSLCRGHTELLIASVGRAIKPPDHDVKDVLERIGFKYLPEAHA